MDLTKYYPDIVAKYPAYVTKRELCEICHICPKTAYNLEQQGEIPYTIEQNHLIRSHKIKLTDILAYLYRRECRQEADSPYICAMRTFYDEHLSPYSDLLSVKDIQQITGFSSSAIVRWISTGILKAFQPGKQYTVPKDFMLDFLISPYYEGIIFTDGVTEVVYYNQLDERWADLPYGTDNIGGYGCGPTSMAIVVSSLTDQTVDPPTMAEWAYQNGYWCSGNGSYHSLIPGAAEGFGLQWESISTDDPQAVVDTLASGKLIVALMSKGHFTSSGHFMVLRGVTSEGKILVADPASKKRSEQEWDISIILDEARKGAAAGGPLWAIY